MIDCLLIFVPFKNISLIKRRHYCRRRAANSSLCSALTALYREGFVVPHVPHVRWHGALIFLPRPNLQCSRLLRQGRGYWERIPSRISTDSIYTLSISLIDFCPIISIVIEEQKSPCIDRKKSLQVILIQPIEYG